jgi:RHS repeat-associated protein
VSDMNIRYYHLDHLGTPRLITGPHGSLIARHAYLPFGGQLSPVTQEHPRRDDPMKFTGHERDAVTGLDYMHARYYSGGLGRFLSVDPGRDWDPRVPQSWNMFGYVRNSPINATDPNGREIRYTTPYRVLVRTNPAFARAHRIWYNSPQGRAQHLAMGHDKNTVYTLGIGRVTLSQFTNEQRAGGTWPPAEMAKAGTSRKLDSAVVTITINANYLSEPRMDPRTVAETIFHESTHALDVGSGTKTREEALSSEMALEEQDGTPDPRLEEYREEIYRMVPP